MLLKEEEINLKIKHTIPEYTTKVEILLSPNVEWANPRYYKKLLMDKAEYTEQIFEINKDKVFEKDMELWGLVLYTTLSNRDKFNNDMQNIEIGNGKFYKYILLYYTLSDIKVAILHVNDINNVEVKYKFIKYVDMNDIMEYEG